jgi:acylphosphatase
MWDGRSGFVAEGERPIRRSRPIFRTNVGAFTFPAAMVRRRVLVHGRVQGVGFRYTLARAAQSRGVVGFARNLADGAVEAVFEGEPEAVDSLVRLAHEGPRGADVLRVEVFEEEPEGLSRFDAW